MYWPRLRLTAEEALRWTPYSSPKLLQKNVIYRAYAGEVILDMTNKEDSETLQISRRSRVFALTASGDVFNIELQIYDSVGEQYTMGFVPVGNLLLGTAADFRGFANSVPASGADPGVNTNFISCAYSIAPHIFEPNIVLEPNQTLTIKARTMNTLTTLPEFPLVNEVSLLSFVLHVWEFPVE